MSNSGWNVDVFYWAEGDPPMARWRRSDDQIATFLQPDVQNIPGAFENSLDRVAFSTQGMWYVTAGDNGAERGVVYFAAYNNPVFSEVARLSDTTGRDYEYAAFPEGLVVCQPGGRLVYVLDPSGILYQQELPDGFIGDSVGTQWLRLNDVVYRPADKGIALVFVLRDDTWPPQFAVGMTDVFVPGQPIGWVDTLYVVSDGTPDPLENIPALIGVELGSDVVFASGASTGVGSGVYYRILTPSSEVYAGLGVRKHLHRVDDGGEILWPETGTAARLMVGSSLGVEEDLLDPEILPIPTTYPFRLGVFIEPRMEDITAAEVSIDGVPYKTAVSNLVPGGTRISTTIRDAAPFFEEGESYNISVKLTRGGAGSTTRTLQLTAGENAWGGVTGYSSPDSFGHVSTDVVAQISGTTYRAQYIQCVHHSNLWGGVGFLNTIPTVAPFWTQFIHTVEELGVVTPAPDPDPDPDPEPEIYVCEFALEVGAAEGVPITGYVIGMLGSISPDPISLLGEVMPVMMVGVAPAALIDPELSGAVFVVQLRTDETVTLDACVVDIAGRAIPVSPIALPGTLTLASAPDDDLVALLDIGSEYPMTLTLTNPAIQPFEPKGEGVVFDVSAGDLGDGRVGFGGLQGSITPVVLTYEGTNFDVISCYTSDRGEEGVLLYIEFQGPSYGFLYEGAGFEYAGRTYPAHVANLDGTILIFEVTSSHIEPFTVGQSVQFTLYPGIAG